MNKLLRILCSIFIFIAIIFKSADAYAKADMLNGVVVSNSPKGGYEVVLETTAPANYTVKKISNDKIILKIKNITPSNNLNARYSETTNLEHVIIKPILGGTIIEIAGLNAILSDIKLLGGIKKSSGLFGKILVLIGLICAICILKKRKRNEYSAKISIADEESQILKVTFERKGALIAKGTGAKRTQTNPADNVRKVKFNDENILRELNIR